LKKITFNVTNNKLGLSFPNKAKVLFK